MFSRGSKTHFRRFTKLLNQKPENKSIGQSFKFLIRGPRVVRPKLKSFMSGDPISKVPNASRDPWTDCFEMVQDYQNFVGPGLLVRVGFDPWIPGWKFAINCIRLSSKLSNIKPLSFMVWDFQLYCVTKNLELWKVGTFSILNSPAAAEILVKQAKFDYVCFDMVRI